MSSPDRPGREMNLFKTSEITPTSLGAPAEPVSTKDPTAAQRKRESTFQQTYNLVVNAKLGTSPEGALEVKRRRIGSVWHGA